MTATSSNTALAVLGVARQAQLVRERKVSPRELVEACLERIARLDPQLNAFRVVLADQAIAQADAVERRVTREQPMLAGVPIAIKDDTDVAGVSTLCGTGVDAGHASADSAAVRRLREAGAIIVAKTHLPEFGMYPMCESATWGVTRNPWNPLRTTGGSSGGSAAAVAAGVVPGALGTDGGGSVRIPAACCGLVGLKGQRGRISTLQAPERAYRFHGLPHVGPLARSVEDAALLHDAMTGVEPGDEIASPPLAGRLADAVAEPPRRLRIAVSFKPVVPVPVSDEVRRPVLETAELLRSLGHEVVERDPVYPAAAVVSTVLLLMHGLAEEVYRLPTTELLERRTRAQARSGGLVPDWLAEAVLRARPRLTDRAIALFDECDVLITPVLARPPVPVGHWEGLGPERSFLRMLAFIPFTPAQNYSGQPAMSVPAGFAADGMPQSVHLVGRPNDEHTLVSLAAQLEDARPWADAWPPVAADLPVA
jgi:amidase